MRISGGLLLLPPYAFKSCGGTKFEVKQFWKDRIYGFFKAYVVVALCIFFIFFLSNCFFPSPSFLCFSSFPFMFCFHVSILSTRIFHLYSFSGISLQVFPLTHKMYWLTNKCTFVSMVVILLHSGHQHVAAGHVATFRVVRTRTQM